MARKPKMPRIRSLGGSWKLEVVNKRMRTPCKRCRCTITANVRIKFVQDAFPFPETMVFCPACARKAVWRAVKAIKITVREFCTYLPPKET